MYLQFNQIYLNKWGISSDQAPSTSLHTIVFQWKRMFFATPSAKRLQCHLLGFVTLKANTSFSGTCSNILIFFLFFTVNKYFNTDYKINKDGYLFENLTFHLLPFTTIFVKFIIRRTMKASTSLRCLLSLASTFLNCNSSIVNVAKKIFA